MFARSPFLRWYNPDRLQIGLNCFQPFGFGYPFANGGGNDATVMPDARLTKILTTGFDFVRLVIDPEALLTADSASNTTTTQLDSRIAELITGILRRTALGLKVIADFHFHGSSVSISSGWQFTDVFDGGTKATRTGFVLSRLATAINKNCSSGMVCFEIFNEPPPPSSVSTASYISQIEAWWAQVRTAMPLHTIVVGGNNLNAMDSVAAGSSSGLTTLTPSHFDVNTGFSFHDYEGGPFPFQNQSGIYQYMHNLTFPASDYPGGQSAAEASFTTAAGGDTNAINLVVTQTSFSSSLAKYFSTYGSKTQLATRLKVVTDWADAASINRKNIMHTEGGVAYAVANEAPVTSAAARLQAVRDNAQAAGINCMVVHSMQGDDFSIQNSTTPWAFNSTIQTALFS